MTGEGPFIVAIVGVITAVQYEPEGRSGTSTFTIVVEDGALEVGEHRYSGDPL